MANSGRHGRHEKDFWVRRSRGEGYRSRAVYKLQEIDSRDSLFRRGITVLDIGAAPGSWCQYATEMVGADGTVVAVDLESIAPLPGVQFMQGDICDSAVRQQCQNLLGGGCDLVICDIAPHITGIASADQAMMQELMEHALVLTEQVLHSGGKSLFKVFSGQAESLFRSELRHLFEIVRVRKPAASRQRSAEFYLLCQGYNGRAVV